MHPPIAHKWACFFLLCGLSTTLAAPFLDDDLFADDTAIAFASPDDGLNTFGSDLVPVDGYSETLPVNDFSQDSLDSYNLFDDNLLGYDSPSFDSGFDLAYNVGDCKYGDIVQQAGSVSFASAGCPSTQPLKGCARGSNVYPCISPLQNIIGDI